jgi:hypothetical protein
MGLFKFMECFQVFSGKKKWIENDFFSFLVDWGQLEVTKDILVNDVVFFTIDDASLALFFIFSKRVDNVILIKSRKNGG